MIINDACVTGGSHNNKRFLLNNEAPLLKDISPLKQGNDKERPRVRFRGIVCMLSQ